MRKKLPPMYVLTIIVFIAALMLLFVVKPENKEALENIENATGNLSCRTVSEDYWILESTNRTPDYLSNATFEKFFSGNTTTFVGKVRITNLENITIKFFINYTFNITNFNGTAMTDKFYVNTTLSPNIPEIIPFYTYGERGADATGSYVITVSNMTFVDNVTKTNSTFKCF
jgi:hypothetical protein